MKINYQHIGERIRSLRELKNLSISDMADKTNFTPKSLLLAENGRAILSLEYLMSICAALEVTPNDILKGEYPENEFNLSVREELINDFTKRLEELKQEQASGSRTKINDTTQTIEEIDRMVGNLKREMYKDETVRKNPNWKPSYFK